LRLELEGQDNPESKPKEGTRNFEVEQRNELGPLPTQNISPKNGSLHDFEKAQVLANMNIFMRLEGLLTLNLGET